MTENNTNVNWISWFRDMHFWVAIVSFVPIFIILVTGIVLLVRREVNVVQPPTQRGLTANQLEVEYPQILENAKQHTELNVAGWQDIELLDVRPNRGIIKVRTNNRWEMQVDAKSGEVLQVMKRNNDWINLIHEGIWTTPYSNETGLDLSLWVFLPAKILFLFLWFSGLFLFFRLFKSKIKVAGFFNSKPKKNTDSKFKKSKWGSLLSGNGTFRWSVFYVNVHYWFSLLLYFPLLVIIISGIILSVQNFFPQILPEKISGPSRKPTLSLVQAYQNATAVEELNVKSWDDIWRIYVFPNQGMLAVYTDTQLGRHEIQMDQQTGEIFQVAKRYTDILQDWHEGRALLGKKYALWVFLPASILALIVWLSGALSCIRYVKRKIRLL